MNFKCVVKINILNNFAYTYDRCSILIARYLEKRYIFKKNDTYTFREF